jgi:hypothetical protein
MAVEVEAARLTHPAPLLLAPQVLLLRWQVVQVPSRYKQGSQT